MVILLCIIKKEWIIGKINKKNVCCICGREYEGYSNNAEPLVYKGRCCDECNKLVINYRLYGMYLVSEARKRYQEFKEIA